jgi:hypothetical protein
MADLGYDENSTYLHIIIMRVMQYGWIGQGAAIGYDRTVVKRTY